MKMRFSIRSILILTAVVACVLATLGALFNEFGPRVFGIFVAYIALFLLIAAVLFGRTLIGDFLRFRKLWSNAASEKARFAQVLKEEVANMANGGNPEAKHPLDD